MATKRATKSKPEVPFTFDPNMFMKWMDPNGFDITAMTAWYNPEAIEKLNAQTHIGEIQKAAIANGEDAANATLDFMRKRLGRDFEVMRELSECRTVNDLSRIQTQFWTDFFSDYRDHMTVMSDAMRHAADNAGEIAAKTTDEATHALRSTFGDDD